MSAADAREVAHAIRELEIRVGTITDMLSVAGTRDAIALRFAVALTDSSTLQDLDASRMARAFHAADAFIAQRDRKP